MFNWIQFEPLRFISSDGPLRGPSGPMGALRTPSGPSDDDVTWPMSLPVEFCSIGFNLNPFGTSVPTGPFGALRAPWGPCGPLGPAGPGGPLRGAAGPFGARRAPAAPFGALRAPSGPSGGDVTSLVTISL